MFCLHTTHQCNHVQIVKKEIIPQNIQGIYINEHRLTPERKPAIKYSGQKVNKTKTDNHHFSPGIHKTMIGRKIF